MKKFLLAAALSIPVSFASAGTMHWNVDLQIYRDFAENKGIFAAGATNVKIVYQNGQDANFMAVVPDFQSSNGPFTLIAPNVIATVAHNGVVTNGTFSAGKGNADSIRTSTVEVRYTAYRYQPVAGLDYLLGRTDKIVVDTVAAPVVKDWETCQKLFNDKEQIVRIGSGTQGIYLENGGISNIAGPYDYLTAGTPGGLWNVNEHGIAWTSNGTLNCIGEKTQLPIGLQAGDSGSPIYIWNPENQRYEFFSTSFAGGGGVNNYASMAVNETQAMLESFTQSVVIGEKTELNWGSANEEVITGKRHAESVVYKGKISFADGTLCSEYVGLQEGKNTWQLIDVNKEKWYAWNTGGIDWDTASGMHAAAGKELFENKNLVFYGNGKNVTINMTGNVDLGIGYIEFDARSGKDAVLAENQTETFTLKNSTDNTSNNRPGTIIATIGNTKKYTLDSAGFIVNEGVTLISELTAPNLVDGKGVEWRKIGAGTFEIAGTGDNYASLSLGGSGVTFLNRDGHAAYNAYLSTGAILKLKNIAQVKRDITIGNGGGKLDLNGNDYVWDNPAQANATSGTFTLHILNENGAVANFNTNTVSTLTLKNLSDNATLPQKLDFYGAFQGNLDVVYEGPARDPNRGTGKTLLLHGNAIDLSAGRSFTVKSGIVELAGTNTVHAGGYVNIDDWHYAKAKMDIVVENAAEFRLGTHARLDGNVNVKAGGFFTTTGFIWRENEFVEGTYWLENVASNENFTKLYGLNGSVNLEAETSTMKIDLDYLIEAKQNYKFAITGTGKLNVSAKKSEVWLSGNNTFSGEKNLTDGILVFENAQAHGNTTANKWKVDAWGAVAFNYGADMATIQSHLDPSSTGTLLLMQSSETALDSNFSGMIVGAYSGAENIHYGKNDVALAAKSFTRTAGTGTTATTTNYKGWELGAGGTLYVDFLLKDDEPGTAPEAKNKLVVGRPDDHGKVVLTNTGNNFSGGILVTPGFELAYDSLACLGQSNITLSYAAFAKMSDSGIFARIEANSAGVLLLERSDGLWAEGVNLSSAGNVALGATGTQRITGTITPSNGNSYNFSGAGTLLIDSALTGANNVVVDAQGSIGGKVVFGGEVSATGTLNIRGRDRSQLPSLWDGSITLQLGNDNQLDAFSSVEISAGGILDLAGTSQKINSLKGEKELISNEVGTITSTGTKTGTLNLISANTESFAGNIGGNLRLVKSGTGTLNLSGQLGDPAGNFIFEIQAGTANLTAENVQNSQITVASAGTLKLTGKQFSSALNLAETARLELGESMSIQGSLQLDKNSGLKFSGDTLEKIGAGNLHIAGTLTGINNFTHLGGTSQLSGAQKTFQTISQTGGNINLGNSSENSFVVKTQCYVGAASGTLDGNLNIQKNAVLTITGDSNSTASAEGAFRLANKNAHQTINVAGVLNVQNAGITIGDGTGTLNISGEANFNAGLNLYAKENGASGGIVRINVQDGGRLNTTGIAVSSGNLQLKLGDNSHLGSLSQSWESSANIELGGNATIDTQVATFNENGSATKSQTAGTIKLTGTLSGDGRLIKDGAGNLELAGNFDAKGGIEVKTGTLKLSGKVELSNAIQNTGTIELNATTFSIGNLSAEASSTGTSGKTYKLIESSNSGTINGETSNIKLSEEFREGATFTKNSQNLFLNLTNTKQLTWAGSSENNIWTAGNTSAEIWTETNGNTTSPAQRFYFKDDVAFTNTAENKTVVLKKSSQVIAGNINFDAGENNRYIFKVEGNSEENGREARICAEKLTLSSGTFQLGDGDRARIGLDVGETLLTGGNFHYNNGGGNLKKISFAGTSSSFHIEDLDSTGLSIEEIALADSNTTGTMSAKWGNGGTELFVDIKKISGAGTLNISGPTNERLDYRLGNLTDFTGTLSLEKKASAMNVYFTQGTSTQVKLAGGVKVNLGKEVNLKLLAGTGFSLDGEGKLEIEKNASLSGYSVASTWTGTVALSDRDSKNGGNATSGVIALNSLGNKNSKIEISGIKGHFAEFAGTVNANLILTNSSAADRNYAIRLENGSSQNTMEFAGKISGAGTLQMAWETGASLKFSGDLSDFSGKIENTTSNKNVTLTFSGANSKSSISGTGDIDWKGNLVYDIANNAFASNKILSGSLSKKGAGTLTLRGNSTYAEGTKISAGILVAADNAALGTGTVTLEKGGRLQLGENSSARNSTNSLVLQNANYEILLDGNSYLDVSAIFGAGKLANASKISVKLVPDSGNNLILTHSYKIYEGQNLSVRNIAGKSFTYGDIEFSFEETSGNYEHAAFFVRDNVVMFSLGGEIYAVPEPSLFGILMGMGALALAASRRRK